MSYLNPGEVILVTGATGAIGFEIAAQAAGDGVVVGVHGARDDSVDSTVKRLQARVPGCRLIPVAADFHNDGAIEQMVARIAGEGGKLDAVIHCAITGAKGAAGLLARADPGSFGRHTALVLGSLERLCHASLPHLAVRGGTIVAFASDAGRFAAPGQAIVGGAFGGIMSFVRNFALEAARDKVRVHCLSPSYVEETPIFEMVAARDQRTAAARERAGLGLPRPADIAPLALFLCSAAASKFTGQIISINGGLNA